MVTTEAEGSAVRGVCSTIFVMTTQGMIPLVFDISKRRPDRTVFWKCPGGTLKEEDWSIDRLKLATRELSPDDIELLDLHSIGESEFYTAIVVAERELVEETHIKVSYHELHLLAIEDRGNHIFFLFGAWLKDVHARGFDTEKLGKEGELVQLFDQRSPYEILHKMADFFKPHMTILEWPETRYRIEKMVSSKPV